MNVQELFTKIRALTYTNKANMPDAVLLTYVDDAHKRFYDEILEINENLLVAKQTIPTVAYQSDYPLTNPSSTVQSVDKIIAMGIKYDDTMYTQRAVNTNYTQDEIVLYNGVTYIAKTDVTWALTFQSASFQAIFIDYIRAKDTNYYERDILPENQTEYAPKYIRGNNTLEIFPTPTKSVTQWIRMVYIPTCIDITDANGNETVFKIPRDQLDTLVYMVRPDVFRYQNKENEAQIAEGKAEDRLQRSLRKLRNRDVSTFEQEDPDLSSYARTW